MGLKKTKFTLSKSSLRKIDEILPKLHFSVLPSKIIEWLENFEEDEVDDAFDILRVFEYITFTELQYRLEDQLKNILTTVNKSDNLLIIPYGKYGKSGTLISYPLSHTPTFKRNIKRITLTHDYENCSISSNHIIFIDDFIGSGDTFCKEYSKGIDKWIVKNKISNVYLLAAVIMEKGKDKITTAFPNIKIYAQERKGLFNIDHSPLIAFKNLQRLKRITFKHGNTIKVSAGPPFFQPYGYQECESLISFAHGTPNNTLPIIWGESKWAPLYPRWAQTRVDEARKIKKKVAFFIGICNRLGVDLYSKDSIIKVSSNGKSKRVIKYNSKKDFSLLALIFLKHQGYSDILCYHILGLTKEELDDIYTLASKKNFVDASKKLTNEAYDFYRSLKIKTRSENFREPTLERLQIKSNLYVPKSFRDLT